MTFKMTSSSKTVGALTAAFLSMASAVQADPVPYPEQLFAVDTVLVEKTRAFESGEVMPYREILTFTRKTSQCLVNKNGVGQAAELEYYLEASPVDIGIQPTSPMVDDQKLREKFVQQYGDEISGSISRIWGSALKSYDGSPMGVGYGDPKFVRPLYDALDDYYKSFENKTGTTINIKIAGVHPGPECQEI